MISRGLKGNLNRLNDAEEDVNPNSYISNLADCMLVVAVGLMVALVTHYGLDLTKNEQPIVGTEVLMDVDGDGMVEDDGFESAGDIYKDTKTGKYYIIVD